MSGLILHEDPKSGNCYKVRLTAAHAGVPLERRCYDILKGETRTAEFLRDVNANGRIPVLQDGQRFLTESNAICFYLATGSDLIPDGAFEQADMLRWLFWEQYHHEPNVATLRFWLRFVGLDAMADAQRIQVSSKREAGLAALDLMDRHLSDRRWFVDDRFTIADICLFAYTHVADEANFDLEAYPAIVRWMERIMTMDGHVEMDI
ncbi:glutathione S-transferase family protein [Sphingomonas xanthus]|uniref:Glutathione S-transferase family protein n=1 Tax=Sphingomonas xanthus TaxID=2594473 RepID=A0A516IPH7_9SPHN|nr:glutathione S-transferase family protein [Sphingomonas xanthus]QDP18838.1 glutathione S-transferase family protein [Sphingomonas xanthus]